jgi:hypothetical protein
MSKSFRLAFVRTWVSFALVCVPVGFISCDSGDSGTQAAGSIPASTPLATPAPVPASTPMPTLVPIPFPVPVPFPNHGSLQPGEYGGDDALVTASDHDVGFRFACANGRISHALQTDDHGNFDVNGTYQPQSGLVPPRGQAAFSARYYGYVDNGHIHFDVEYDDQPGHFTDQAYDVFYGNAPSFTTVCPLVTPTPTGTP